MQPNSLLSFIIKVFLWLPICYCLWYFSAPYMTLVTSCLTKSLLEVYFSDLVLEVEQIGSNLELIVKATIPSQDLPKGMIAELPYLINPLKYYYGLPLCLALILSSPDKPLRHSRNIALSILLLFPVQIWGVCFDFLKSLFLQTPSHLIGHVILQKWQMDLVAIGYQIGSLVLPPVTPLIIWLVLYKHFIVEFIPSLRQMNI